MSGPACKPTGITWCAMHRCEAAGASWRVASSAACRRICVGKGEGVAGARLAAEATVGAVGGAAGVAVSVALAVAVAVEVAGLLICGSGAACAGGAAVA